MAAEVADPARTIYHHLHVARLQWTPDEEGSLKLKRVLYTVRSVATLNWLRVTGGTVPPMDLPTLLAEADVPRDAEAQILELATPETIKSFIEEEFELAEASVKANPPQKDRKAAHAAAERFFQSVVLG